MSKVIFYNNEYKNYHDKLGKLENLVVGDFYKINDVIYEYKGDEDSKEPGIYLREDGKLKYIKYKDEPLFTDDNIIEIDDDLFNVEENKRVEEEVKPKRTYKKRTTPNVKTSRQPRIPSTEIIKMEISIDDSVPVRLIKEKLNEKKISCNELYSKAGGYSVGYNLYYGLKQRTSLTWELFLRWCAILDCEPNLTLTDCEE